MALEHPRMRYFGPAAALLRFADLNEDSGLLHIARQWAQRLWAGRRMLTQ
jgi:hypothetical protein